MFRTAVDVELDVEHIEAGAFLPQFFLLREWLAQLRLCVRHLLAQVLQAGVGCQQTVGDPGQRVVHADKVALGVLAQLDAVLHLAFHRQDVILPEVLHREGHGKAAIAADLNRVGADNLLAGGKERRARVVLIGEHVAADGQTGKPIFRVRVIRGGLDVGLKPGDKALYLLDFLREVFQQVVLQTELLALVVCFQQLQPRHLNVKVHLLADQRIARAQGLDLRVGKRGFVHVLAGAHRGFAGHDLRDKLLLVLHRLPEVGIECAVGDVAVDMDSFVFVALPDNAALALLQVAGTPRAVQVMQGDEPVLDIHARSHLEGAAHKDAHLTSTNLGEQLLLFRLGVRVVDKGDLLRGDASGDELVADVLIDGKGRVRRHVQQIVQRVKLRAARRFAACCHCGFVLGRRCRGFGDRQIAKDELGQLVGLSVPPDLQDIRYA